MNIYYDFRSSLNNVNDKYFYHDIILAIVIISLIPIVIRSVNPLKSWNTSYLLTQSLILMLRF